MNCGVPLSRLRQLFFANVNHSLDNNSETDRHLDEALAHLRQLGLAEKVNEHGVNELGENIRRILIQRHLGKENEYRAKMSELRAHR